MYQNTKIQNTNWHAAKYKILNTVKISHRDIAVCEKLAPDFEKLPYILVIGQLKEWGWGGFISLFPFGFRFFIIIIDIFLFCQFEERGWGDFISLFPFEFRF